MILVKLINQILYNIIYLFTKLVNLSFKKFFFVKIQDNDYIKMLNLNDVFNFFFYGLKKKIISLFLIIKFIYIQIFFNFFYFFFLKPFRLLNLFIDIILMFIIFYNVYINYPYKRFNYFINNEYPIMLLDKFKEFKEEKGEGSPDLKIYYPMVYAMKSVMIRLTGVILFLFIFIILIFEFLTTYISPNLVVLFFPMLELKFLKLKMIFEINVKYDFFLLNNYFNINNQDNMFHLIKRILYLVYFYINICILYFCFFLKFFFLFSWSLVNKDITLRIMFFYILSKNMIFSFLIIHIYYTFFHTYTNTYQSFKNFLIFIMLSLKVILFYLKILFNYFKIIIKFILSILNTKTKPPLTL